LKLRWTPLVVLRLAVVGVAVAYVALLFAWYAVSRLFGDAPSPLYAVNALALYLFLPLPLLLPIAAVTRRWEVAGCFVAGAALWVFLWGGLFWPPVGRTSAADDGLTVMTYNVLGFNHDPDSVVETIEDSRADVVAFQELNLEVAAAVSTRLGDEYPYQFLRPAVGVTGMGIISRRPASQLEQPVPDEDWVGEPQLIDIEFDGREVLLLNIHAAALREHARARLEQSRLIRSFAQGRTEPLLVLGDFNATSTNESIRLLSRTLHDAWLEAGSGFGHTFPGASTKVSPGSSRPSYFGVEVPRWLVRIDYVFHSPEWHVMSARNGHADGMSDHRPVIATVVLKN
jgi:endonuclease/exonuclease/phosphatase (EEP) superfamily protein YafD